MDLFGRIEDAAAKMGLDASALCRKAGIARQTFYNIRRRKPNLDTLDRIAHVLGVEPAELIRGGESAPTPESVTLARLRDLLRPDGTDRPKRTAEIIEMEWRAVFQSPPEPHP